MLDGRDILKDLFIFMREEKGWGAHKPEHCSTLASGGTGIGSGTSGIEV